MSYLHATMICLVCLAVNAGFFYDDPNAWSLGGMVLCGSLAVLNALRDLR